ncbi:hypothetical protein BKA67DRAFT_586544 [Truncatella angustata]|uniref:Rhodopsin domain-containing protein n=1 Tax=Truncatella angustata TaxID=152316 RepID=A0A9P8RFM0_9PEZI|nr:uncharacterized protein BKA67DRAFT_586544 [Truncatella angustata]KAH6644954.1 hypothetical protein BKA67DRAFT_586544 [Truncatella angustata]
MRRICIIAMVVIGSWSLSQFLLTVFLCVPVAGFWDASIQAKCIPTLPEWYQNAAGNIFTDIVIFCLPLPMLGRLNLPRTQKWILLGIFSLGFFTCTISIIRIKYLHLEIDATWQNVESSLWSLCELCSGTTCSCLPCLRPLASRWLPVLSSRYGNGYNQQPESHIHMSEGHVDLESGRKRHLPGSSVESDSDMIFGLEDYRLNASSSGDDPGALTGSGQKAIKMFYMAKGPSLRIPKPLKTASGRVWVQPVMATREGQSGTPVDTRDRYWSVAPVIRVKREIYVYQSRL